MIYPAKRKDLSAPPLYLRRGNRRFALKKQLTFPPIPDIMSGLKKC